MNTISPKNKTGLARRKGPDPVACITAGEAKFSDAMSWIVVF